MKLEVLDNKGKKVEDIDLKKEIFDSKPNADLIAQYVRVFRSNQRQGTSSAKTRSEVSGGGKKPWNQKGTGRARVGSNRNPIWVGGGVAHGPKPKSWSLTMPKKMKRAVLISALSIAASNKQIKVLDKFEVKEPKTKDIDMLAKNLKTEGKTLFITNKVDRNFVKSLRNLPEIEATMVGTLNAYEVLSSKTIVFFKDAIQELENKLTK